MLLSACTASNGAPDAVECAAPDGIPDAGILLFGEMHGSVETPALVGRVACRLATEGATALALEIGTQEQARIDAFLDSDGGDAARETLLQGRFWQSNDGRSSQAKLDLLDLVRTLKARGLPLQAVAFIPDEGAHPAGISHDERMAREIRSFHDRHPETRIVGLIGNLHAGKEVVDHPEFRLEPTGYFLKDLDVSAIYVGYHAGSIWACMPECGLHPITSQWGEGRAAGFTRDAPSAGYDLSYVLPSLTASPPAREGISPAPAAADPPPPQ